MRYLIVIISFLLFSLNAYAADTLTYSPPSQTLTIPAGESAKFSLNVFFSDSNGYPISKSRFYFIRYIDSISGNLPISWLAAYKPTSWFIPASTAITVKVPANTPPGTYSGMVSSATSGGAHIQSTQKFYMEVIVPSACKSAPKIEIESFSPDEIWPPNHKTEYINVTGRVSAGEGCKLYEFGFGLEDEYGEFTSMGAIIVEENGKFSVSIPVEASREGTDIDGRHYTVTIIATDEAGHITESDLLQSIVPHDQRPDK